MPTTEKLVTSPFGGDFDAHSWIIERHHSIEGRRVGPSLLCGFAIFLACAVVLEAPSSLSAQNVFRAEFLFPVGNPWPSEILSDVESWEMFRIGPMIFVYGDECVAQAATSQTNTMPIETAAHAVEIAQPDSSIVALVTQQLGSFHRFELQEVESRNHSQLGPFWHVTWNLFPSGGFSGGKPYQYSALVTRSGKVIVPDKFLYDVYSPSSKEAFLCSTIQVRTQTPTGATDPVYSEEAIVDRARRKLEKLVSRLERPPEQEASGSGKPSNRMRLFSQQSHDIPMAVAKDGRVKFQKMWAVNFVESRPNEQLPIDPNVFTVWVSPNGTVATLRLLHHNIIGGSQPVPD